MGGSFVSPYLLLPSRGFAALLFFEVLRDSSFGSDAYQRIAGGGPVVCSASSRNSIGGNDDLHVRRRAILPVSRRPPRVTPRIAAKIDEFAPPGFSTCARGSALGVQPSEHICSWRSSGRMPRPGQLPTDATRPRIHCSYCRDCAPDHPEMPQTICGFLERTARSRTLASHNDVTNLAETADS